MEIERVKVEKGKYLVRVEKSPEAGRFHQEYSQQQYGKIVQTGEGLANRNGFYVYFRNNAGFDLNLGDEQYKVLDSARSDILVFIFPGDG